MEIATVAQVSRKGDGSYKLPLSRKHSKFDRQGYSTQKREDKHDSAINTRIKTHGADVGDRPLIRRARDYARGGAEPADGRQLIAIKTAQDANKAKLAQYTWTETETIAIKGEVKDTKIY